MDGTTTKISPEKLSGCKTDGKKGIIDGSLSYEGCDHNIFSSRPKNEGIFVYSFLGT